MHENEVATVAREIQIAYAKAVDERRIGDVYTDAARAALAKTSAFSVPNAPIANAEELDALPLGSVVNAHWEDGSRPDYLTMRCREGGASSSGFGVAGGKHWTGIANWGATLTLRHFGGSDV